MSRPGKTEKVAIFLHNGSYDRVQYALWIALVSLAMGMEVHMLCTYGALKRFKKGNLEMLENETPPDIRESLEKGLKSRSVQSISEALKDAISLGLKLYACTGAMANLNITRDELIDEIDSSLGLASFIRIAKESKLVLYI